MPVSPSSVPQKRSFSVVSQASSPDVLLLAPELEVPTVTASTRIASDKSGTPSGPASAANSASPEQPEPLQDVDQRRSKEPDQHAEYHSKERGLDAVSHASDLQTDVAVQRADRNEWSGPPLHAYVREPPVRRSAYYRRREQRILDDALKTSAERAKSSATRYNPTPGWQSLSRVPDRLPFLTRSETPAQRYTEILEQLYGPGDVRRGNGRRPGKVHSEVGRPVVSSDVESDDENEEIAAGEEENLRSDDSSSAPPVTPPDPALFSSSSATLLHAPAIVDSPEQPPHMEREIEIGPVPTETVDTSEHPSPLGIDGDLLALTSPVPAFDSSKTTSVRDVVIRRSALGMPVDGFLPEAEASMGPNGPVHQIKWHNLDDWKRSFRKLISGKNRVWLADLEDIDRKIMSLEEMIQALPGEAVITALVSNVREYLMQIRDLPEDYIPFGDQFNLRRRADDVLRSAFTEDPIMIHESREV
ncbi:hypothetical protein DFH11DRAFT_190325 [Phellopilus nigrolimitatus]|nr:hypothetical protein DFH11DRAFT_190325 [Phellopilus nigrolimitatus]